MPFISLGSKQNGQSCPRSVTPDPLRKDNSNEASYGAFAGKD